MCKTLGRPGAWNYCYYYHYELLLLPLLRNTTTTNYYYYYYCCLRFTPAITLAVPAAVIAAHVAEYPIFSRDRMQALRGELKAVPAGTDPDAVRAAGELEILFF